MKVVITGAGGFIGVRLVRQLLNDVVTPGQNELELVLVDQKFPNGFMKNESRVRLLEGDLTSEALIEEALGDACDWLMHLAATLTIHAEENFEYGMEINFRTVHRMLDLCRRQDQKVRFFMPSSIAVFSGELPDVVDDAQPVKPASSYGTEKALCELLLNEYARRGFVDCRCMRLPFVLLRPGNPTGYVSDLVTSITREPLYRRSFEIPWKPESRLSVVSLQRVVDAIIALQCMSEDALGDSRVINMPSLSVTIQDMVDSLKRVAGAERERFLSWKPSEDLQTILDHWPKHFVSGFAATHGIGTDKSFDDILSGFVREQGIPS